MVNEGEHRRAPRVARSVIVRYRCPEAGQTVWLVSPLRDVSSGGARFLSEQTVAIGRTIEMQLMLPTASQPVSLLARVVRTKPAQTGLIEVGVTFSTADVAVQRAIDRAVAHFLHKQERSG